MVSDRSISAMDFGVVPYFLIKNTLWGIIPYLSAIVLCHQKEAENFRRLLRSPAVLQELDCASLAKAKVSKQLTWDNVFR